MTKYQKSAFMQAFIDSKGDFVRFITLAKSYTGLSVVGLSKLKGFDDFVKTLKFKEN